MDDSDEDGLSNRDEFIAGTNPRDAFSQLAIHEVRRDASGLSLFFSSVNGKTYAVEFSESLPTANWQALGNVVGDGAEQIMTDTNALMRQRFYRIRVRP